MLLLTITLLVAPPCQRVAVDAPISIPWLTALPARPGSEWYRSAMDSLGRRDGEADAQRTLARGDCRLMTIVGYAPDAPGLSGSLRDYPFGYYYFQGTSDSIDSDWQSRFTLRAYSYAQRYNRLVLAQVKTKTTRPAP